MNKAYYAAAAAGLFLLATPAFAAVPSLTSAKVTGNNTVTIIYSEPVNANWGDYGNFTGTLAGRGVTAVSGSGTNTIVVTLGGDPFPADAAGYITIGSNTTSIADGRPFPGGVFSLSDAQAPSIASFSISSSNNLPIGKMGSQIYLSFTTNEPVSNVAATILGHTNMLVGNGAGPYTLSYKLVNGDPEGAVPVTMAFTDAAGNSGRVTMNLATGATSNTTPLSAGFITSTASSAGTLKVGDSITFTFTPSIVQPNAKVTGSYNGVPLSWYTPNNGSTYMAMYVVANGNADQPYPLQISGVTLTDQFGNVSNPIGGSDVMKSIDAHSPSIYEITAVPTLSTTATPRYMFSSSEAGTIKFVGDCVSQSNNAYSGTNTVIFNSLTVGLHNNCSLTVVDAVGNSSNPLTIAPFTVKTDGSTANIVAPAQPASSADLAAQLLALQNQLVQAQGQTLSNKYMFTLPLSLGSDGKEVTELQKRLKAEGYLTASPNGYFGPATQAAVKAFQKARGLSPIGTVGPGTRAALNK